MREAHVPAQQSQAQEEARFPSADAQPRRAGGAEGPPPAGPQAAVRLIWRVRERGTFEALGRARPRAAGPLRVRAVPVSAGDPPRVAYAVGRGVGNAVHRNRLRRRLREAVRANFAALLPGWAYLVAARPEAGTMTAEELSAAVRTLLDELRGDVATASADRSPR